MQEKEKVISKPDFGKIFWDMAQKKNLSDKQKQQIVGKKNWRSLDVVKMSEKLFGGVSKESLSFNQSHRAYDEKSIKYIVNYQKKHGLSNSEVARQFRLSRTTIIKWQKMLEKNIKTD